MKHAAGTITYSRPQRAPKHVVETLTARWYADDFNHGLFGTYTPGRHAKPFAAHHPARPVTYDATGTTTPLNPPTNVLDAVA